jgi:hypothetical protein
MYCTGCGYVISNNHKFCANCGTIAADDIPLPECPPSRLESAEFCPFPDEYADIELEALLDLSRTIDSVGKKPKQKQERLFFSWGALVFCLVIIAILTVTAATFIGLYFTEFYQREANSGRSIPPAIQGGISYSQA